MTNLNKLLFVAALTTPLAHAALTNGVYTISSKYSDKHVEVGGASVADGANIIQWPANGHDTQKWIVTQHDSGYYSLLNLNSGKAMETYAFGTADGDNVAQWQYWGGDGQLWNIGDQGNGYYAVINKNSGKGLDLLNWDTSDGANIGQWSWWGGDAQQWKFNLIKATGAKPVDTSSTNGNVNHWPLSGNIVTHDPTIMYENGTWWEFQTGDGINGKYSHDGVFWEPAAAIFSNGLSWWKNYVPGHDGMDVWAPDVKYYNGRVWLYYSISTFGSRVSAIGLASASSIASGDWVDHGLVINTTNNDNWNAIDPDLVIDEDGNPWLTMGSWNSGIKLMRLNPITMKPIGEIYSLASRLDNEVIEAPTIIYRQGYYYLFVSVGRCCIGVDSTYRVLMGRSKTVTGPYLDRSGVDMMNGGGTLFDGGGGIWVGPGGQDIANTDVIARHAYDASDNGTPKLLISTLNWDSAGWPRY